MINRYGLVPLAFALFVFVIFFTSLVPSPHKSCIDRNLAVLNNLDEAKYSESEIKELGLSIGLAAEKIIPFNLQPIKILAWKI